VLAREPSDRDWPPRPACSSSRWKQPASGWRARAAPCWCAPWRSA